MSRGNTAYLPEYQLISALPWLSTCLAIVPGVRPDALPPYSFRLRDTGQPRGFAFVEMTNAAEARDAIRTLNGSVHGGRALIVNEARPKLYRNGEHESLPSRNSCFTKWGLSTLRQSSPKGEAKQKRPLLLRMTVGKPWSNV